MNSYNTTIPRDSIQIDKVRALLPERERDRSTHKWACNSCADLHELGGQWVLTSPETKETTPKGKAMNLLPYPCSAQCLQNLKLQIKSQVSAVIQDSVKVPRNGEARHCGTLFNTATVGVRP